MTPAEWETLVLSIDPYDPDRGLIYRGALEAKASAGDNGAAQLLLERDRWGWNQSFAKDLRRFNPYVRARGQELPTVGGLRRGDTSAQLSLLDWTRDELARGRDDDYRQSEHMALNGKLKDYLLSFLATHPNHDTVREAIESTGQSVQDFWKAAEAAI